MPPRKNKKLVYVPQDLLEEVANASRNRGESIGKFIEESLAQAVRVNMAGHDIQKLADFFEVMYAQRVLGGAFVPLGVLDYLTGEACKEGFARLGEVWFESGKWHGKYLKEKFENPVRALKNFLLTSRWDLSEVDAKKEGNITKIRCVSTILTDEATGLLAKFIEGIMSGMSYKLEKSDCVKGMIVLEFKR